MNRTEFPRVSPEQVGISSRVIDDLFEQVQRGPTQMHGMMVMRHGCVCAEGWWQPYAPGKRHTCHSLTKTYMGTAIGIALRENALRLEDRAIDYFPEYRAGTTLPGVTIRDVLCMASGVASFPQPTEHWIRDFFLQPRVHAPGTSFFYNSAGSTLLGFIVQRATGEPVYEYLRTRLFERIGIDPDNSFPTTDSPAHDLWAHRMLATTEDNLRLMKLYLDGGTWEGERILNEEYVRLATSKQIETISEGTPNPNGLDNQYGYGFQMWMCRPHGVYRADGAGGQYSIVAPELDIVVAVSESGTGAEGPQHTLNCIWDGLFPHVSSVSLPEDAAAFSDLGHKLKRLAIEAPPYKPWSPMAVAVSGVKYAISEGAFDLYYRNVPPLFRSDPAAVDSFSLTFSVMEGSFCWAGKDFSICRVNFALDGGWRRNQIDSPDVNARECYAAGYWSADDTFTLLLHWTESLVEKRISFHWDGAQVAISGVGDYMPGNEDMGSRFSAAAFALRG